MKIIFGFSPKLKFYPLNYEICDKLLEQDAKIFSLFLSSYKFTVLLPMSLLFEFELVQFLMEIKNHCSLLVLLVSLFDMK